MIMRILAMIAHEFMEEYRKLESKPFHDESVTGFSTELSKEQTESRDGIGFTAKWQKT